MGYYLKTAVGAALFLAALVAFNYALLKLLETGTCASGNTPYAIARPCPEGTGTYAAILFGAIFAGLLGAGVFAFRGDRPGSEGAPPAVGFLGWGSLAWGLFFGGTGVTAIVCSLTRDLPTGGRTGGLIVGVTFALMGLPVLLFALRGIVKKVLSRPDERPSLPASAPPAGSGGDALDRIGRLDALRRSGALSQAEFDREKAKMLAEG